MRRLKRIAGHLVDLFRIGEGGHLVDEREATLFEKSFLIPLSLVSIFFSAVSLIINFFWNFPLGSRILGCGTLVFYFLIYFLAKKVSNINFTRWLFLIVTLIFANIAWYYDYRSAGPMLYLLFLFYGYLIFMLDNKKLLRITVVVVVDIAMLYFLESRNLIPPSHYPSPEMQRVDAYTAVLLYTLIAGVLMWIAKKNYFTEYHKALESDKLKTRFLSNMSHEIRTPLNAVIGFSNLMLTEEVSQEDRTLYKSYINENNRYLLSLINDILDISMIESNTIKLEEEPCNLNLIILEMQKNYKAELIRSGNRNLEIVARTPRDPVVIEIDRNYLERTLRLLMDNAVKFTARGSVEIGFSVESKAIRFFVKDTGIGIRKEDMGHLFERFNKLEYNKEKVLTGTGIGLYLVKLIVRMFGGTVAVESTYGEGSEFSFSIPAQKLRMTPKD